MTTISSRSIRWVSVYVLVLGLAGGLISPATAQEANDRPFDSAQDKQRQGERPTIPLAEPESPGSGGGTPLGTAPDLSVFSVMKFSGALSNALDEPRTGTVGITFAFYSEQYGGAPLWLETQNVQLDSEGRYTALLGMTKHEGLPLDFFSSGEARWLGIQAGTEPEQQRILLVSVPYALKAAEADRLGGMTADEFVSNEEFEERIRQEIEERLAVTEESEEAPARTKPPSGTAGVAVPRVKASSPAQNILSVTSDSVVVFAVDAHGNVTAGVDVVATNGDFIAKTPSAGIIVRSPDGLTCKRLGIDNAGKLLITPTPCP